MSGNSSPSSSRPRSPRSSSRSSTRRRSRPCSSPSTRTTAVGARGYAICVLLLDTGMRSGELLRHPARQRGLRARVDQSQRQGRQRAFGAVWVHGQESPSALTSGSSAPSLPWPRWATSFSPATATRCLPTPSPTSWPGSGATRALTACTPTSGRHTAGVRYLMAGGDVFSLQTILGHSTLEMTRHYVQLASHHIEIQHRRFSPADNLGLARR